MVAVKIGRKTHKLKLTLGAVEDIPADVVPGYRDDRGEWHAPAHVPFMPASTLNSLVGGVYSMRDLRVVVEAGIDGGKIDLSYDDVFDAHGLKGTGKIALDLLMEFFGIDQSGKADAAPDPDQKAAQTGSD